ncbi:MAG: CHAT domain-containing protein [Phycisphaerae bacterium]|nr:CHAT domain-containing protein [Saprospiraceae bacterium]
MNLHWIFIGLLFAGLGCGLMPSTPKPSACQLSAAAERPIKAYIALADSFAKAQNIHASDSINLLALNDLKECKDRYLLYRCHFRHCMNAWNLEHNEIAIDVCSIFTFQAESQSDSISGYYNSLLGWFHFEQGNFEAARPYLEKAADLLEASGRTQKLPAVYNNLAPCLIRLGDYEAAEHYLRAAIRLNASKRDSNRLAINYYNLGRNFNAQLQSEKAIECFEHSAALSGEKDADYFEGMTKAHFNLKAYEKAQSYAIRYLKKTKEEDGDIAEASQWLGQIEAAKGAPQKAISHYRQALATWTSSQDTAHYDFGKTKIFLGDAYTAIRKPSLALASYQSALNGFIPNFESKDICSNPKPEQLPNEIWVMEALLNKAIAWEQAFDQNTPKDSTLLKNALECAELATLAFVKMKSLYGEDASKLNLDQYGFVRFFEKAVQIATRLANFTQNEAYAQRAFYLSQRSKAGILRNALQERAALFSAHLPKDSIQKMDRLQRELALIDRQLGTEKDSLVSDSLSAKRFYAKRKWTKMQKWASQKLPPPLLPVDLSIPEIQQKLSSDALMIEYFVGADRCYSFAVSKTDFRFFEAAISPNLEEKAALLLRAVSDQNWVRDSMSFAEKAYLQQAFSLYDLLLSKPLEGVQNVKRLLIVPDAVLGRIPFSALLTQPHEGGWCDTDLPILLQRYAVSYLYSSALLQDMEQVKQAKYGFGGFGADYRDPYTLSSLNQQDLYNNSSTMLAWAARGGPGVLENADDEVDSIAQITGGNKWLNDKASKAKFLQESNTCGILHFALHTVESPPDDLSGFYLMFSKIKPFDDNFLSSNELAALDLNAELAVVSACYSGLGTFQQGEGTMNLGRAFALSGCPSTVVNLWQAHDEASKKIMIAFYKNLKALVPKDIALQKAQLEYLKQIPSESAAPFFWANFVVMGDVSALEVPASRPWWKIWAGG